jgi:hypothetical protein
MKLLLAVVSCATALLVGCADHPLWDDSPEGRAAQAIYEAKDLYNTQVRPFLGDRELTGSNDVGLATATSDAFMVRIAGRGIKEGRYWFEPGTTAWGAVTHAGGLSSITAEVDVLRDIDTDKPHLFVCELVKSPDPLQAQLSRIVLEKGDIVFVQLQQAPPPPEGPFNPFRRP